MEDAHSDAALDETSRIFRETPPTRLNNPADSAILIVMQRLSVKDVSGVITSEDMGYEHLCLPMEYEGLRKATSIGFVDPRKEAGELLFPARFPREVVERDIMGPYAVAGQFQQRLGPAEGGEFQPDTLQVVDVIPAGPIQWCRGWDLAATEGTGDYTAGGKVGRLAHGRFIVTDVVRKQCGTTTRDQLIKNTASADGMGRVKQSLPQDLGQAGKSQALAMTSMLAGHQVETSLESGDKVVRARPFASQVNGGNVLMLRGMWNQDFVEALRLFERIKRRPGRRCVASFQRTMTFVAGAVPEPTTVALLFGGLAGLAYRRSRQNG